MKFKQFILVVVLSCFAIPAAAQSTAAEVTPGYLTTLGCQGSFTACFHGLTAITPLIAGSSASSKILKASPGALLGVYFTAGGTAGYGMVFNSVTDPSDGSTTAGTASGNMEECIAVPAGTTQGISFQGLPVEAYSVGITAVFSSTGCATKTDSATAFIRGMVQ